ncbi:hypothetical protein ACM7Q1_09400 [Paenibacillus illinoisensis]
MFQTDSPLYRLLAQLFCGNIRKRMFTHPDSKIKLDQHRCGMRKTNE